MFFSDLMALQKIATKQINPLETRYGDHAGDPEIERMLNGSPMITGWEPTVPCEELYAGNDEDSFNDRFDVSGKSSRKRWKEIFGSQNQPSDYQSMFKEKSTPSLASSTEEKCSSALTKLMEESRRSRRKEKSMVGKVKLSVYLPDYSNFNVYASEKMTISDLRNLILDEHLEQGLIPPLNYHNPNLYELRMTDGDGEPDRDFPALGLTQRLGELGIDEVCICEIEGGRGGGGGAGGGGGGGGRYSSFHSSNRRGKPSVDFTFSASQFGSIPYGRSISNARSTPPPLLSGSEPFNPAIPPSYVRDRLDENDEEEDDDDNDELQRGRSSSNFDNPHEPEDRIVTIKFPNGQEITLPYDEQSTLKSLLPVIAETHKLLLHSADYVFCVPNNEMKRLKLMIPSVDMNVTIDSIRCQTFELQNRIFADSTVPKVPVPDIVTKSQRERMAAASSAAAAAGDSEGAFVFTEATANAYKEWNVVKKNKFGRRQERIFGVDGKKVYNAKRGQLKGTQSGVQRNQRDISTIVKIDILPSDSKTFRITWAEDRDMINIEYTCDTSREAQEIVAKIKFLVNKTVRSAVSRSGR